MNSKPLYLIASLFVVCGSMAATTRPSQVAVDRARREIRFTATVQPGAMERPFGVKGHHAIVWKEGKSAMWALFQADASDQEVRRALDELGVRAGDNLTAETWTERDDPRSAAPAMRVDGARVAVLVEWEGSRGAIPLRDLITGHHGEHRKVDFRYGGNERFRKEFKSGCIVCLYSCPGGAIGNRSKTIRDYVNEGVVFEADKQRLPPRGTKVMIILKVM
jgi:hypothetical protein